LDASRFYYLSFLRDLNRACTVRFLNCRNQFDTYLGPHNHLYVLQFFHVLVGHACRRTPGIWHGSRTGRCCGTNRYL
jgi:hypothetical protein